MSSAVRIARITNKLTNRAADLKKYNGLKLMVCDMAGTVVNEQGIVYDTLYDVINSNKMPVTNEEIKENYGKSKYEVLDSFLVKHCGIYEYNNKRRKLHLDFNNQLKERYFFESNNISLIHKNVPILFNKLRNNNIKVALNTGYSKDIQELIINKLGLNDYIDDYISSDLVPAGRPKPYMIKKLMTNLDIKNANHVLKVGDTPMDILEGKNARCGYVVGVLSGNSSIPELNLFKPNDILNNIIELEHHILT